MIELDAGTIIFLGLYSAFSILIFVAGCRKYNSYKLKKNKPKLTLIQGGKK